MKWSLDEGVSWEVFAPNIATVYLKGTLPDKEQFKQLLSKEDWKTLPEKLVEFQPITYGTKIIMEARNQYEIEDNPTYSFVLGVSALELAIEELFAYKKRINDKKWLSSIYRQSNKEYNKRFTEIGLAKKVRVIGKLEKKLSPWIDDCAKAVSTRNAIVHNGKRLVYSEIFNKQFYAIVHVTGNLLLNQILKYPRYSSQNTLLARKEDWE